MKKLVEIDECSCDKCPHFYLYSFAYGHCALKEKDIEFDRSKQNFPDWCPLPDSEEKDNE